MGRSHLKFLCVAEKVNVNSILQKYSHIVKLRNGLTFLRKVSGGGGGGYCEP
jgi:hypothetical protein